MGLVGYIGNVLGNFVDISYRNVIRIIWLLYNSLEKIDAFLSIGS